MKFLRTSQFLLVPFNQQKYMSLLEYPTAVGALLIGNSVSHAQL